MGRYFVGAFVFSAFSPFQNSVANFGEKEMRKEPLNSFLMIIQIS
jgi:hypothetical protein